MNYQLEYDHNMPIRVIFRPNFITSNGTFNDKLGIAVLTQNFQGARNDFIPGWHWSHADNALVYPIKTLGEHDFERMVTEAQDRVTEMMDYAYMLRTFVKAWKETEA